MQLYDEELWVWMVPYIFPFYKNGNWFGWKPVLLSHDADSNEPKLFESSTLPILNELQSLIKYSSVRLQILTEHSYINPSYRNTRPVTGRSLRIYRLFTQKGFEIFVDKELSNTRKLIEAS